MKWLLMALSLTMISCAGKQNNPDIPINNFYQVDKNIYRSAQPSHDGMVWLSQHGIKNIINLNDNVVEMNQELLDAEALGIVEINIPLASFATPDKSDIVMIEALIDTSPTPVLVHCEHGRDRSGLVVGIYRMLHDHWSPKDAHDEMMKYGFHTSLLSLESYFWDVANGRR